jgi:virginiamycin A acetyltransferase
MANWHQIFSGIFYRKYYNQKEKFLEYQKRDIFIHPESEIGTYTNVGSGTNINGPAFIASSKQAPVTIGKYCAIAHNLRIRPRNHCTNYMNLQDKFQDRYNLPKLDAIKGPVTIGNNVWIADNVIVLSGVEIGDGAVIGAGSVVTKDIPPFCVAVGNPATVIKQRFCENIINQLLEIKWWDWSAQKIELNRHIFEIDLTQNQDINLFQLI